ncbi:MAG: DNA topoisomerase I, partial [Deltaproteobacteria bacterium]|nr:DNA topoisomerase I [Deltaproteobacteria bacterium]
MGKDLIIVESPAKVKTIKKFLGNKYSVHASVGHIRDLPTSTLGVDEANGYAPVYQVIEGKEKVVADLQTAAAKADTVYLAPDPDREGEAIAWHIAELLKDSTKAEIKRIQFNEITAKAVREALEHPRGLNVSLFDAQQARRVLDRLVGYKISPLLWKKVKRGISAGRVQSVALRLVVDRDKERRAFVPEEYWLMRAFLSAGMPPTFRADLHKVDGKKPNLCNEASALAVEARVLDNKSPFVVDAVEVKDRERAPAPPFITSTLQQVAN